MKWFKHYSDNHRGQSIQYLLDNLGYFGPFFYYLIYEMCSEKLDFLSDRDLSEDDCEFVFHRRVVCSASRAKPSTVGRALDAGQSCGLWTYSLDGFQIKIRIPILLILLDRDTNKTRKRRAKDAEKTRLEEEGDKYGHKDVDVVKQFTTSSVEKFELNFNEDAQKLKKFFNENKLSQLNYRIADILKTFQNLDSFENWYLGITESKIYKDFKTYSEKTRYMVGCLKKEIGEAHE